MKHTFYVGMDSDGHFMLCDKFDRLKTLKFLKKLEDGDVLANSSFSNIDSDSILNLDYETYIQLIDECMGRGRMEEVTIHF